METGKMARALGRAFAGGCKKPGFGLCQFSIQNNHLHLVCEADSHEVLGRAMQGLGVRAAKAINRACGRRGSVFAERYRVTRVSTPTQMRNTLCYVLHNARRHGARVVGADPFSSARYFDGFSRRVVLAPVDEGARARSTSSCGLMRAHAGSSRALLLAPGSCQCPAPVAATANRFGRTTSTRIHGAPTLTPTLAPLLAPLVAPLLTPLVAPLLAPLLAQTLAFEAMAVDLLVLSSRATPAASACGA